MKRRNIARLDLKLRKTGLQWQLDGNGGYRRLRKSTERSRTSSQISQPILARIVEGSAYSFKHAGDVLRESSLPDVCVNHEMRGVENSRCC